MAGLGELSKVVIVPAEAARAIGQKNHRRVAATGHPGAMAAAAAGRRGRRRFGILAARETADPCSRRS